MLASTVAVLALAAASSAWGASTTCKNAIAWQSARKAVGTYATIKGRVAGAKYASWSNGSPTFVDLGVAYPSARRFTIVIWGENRARFGAPENRYRNRTLCVRGYVDTYNGIPEIEATTPTQISIVG